MIISLRKRFYDFFFVKIDALDFRNIICEQKRSLSGNRPAIIHMFIILK